MSEAARSRRDEARHGPQTPSPRDGGAPDPLAELARLVGQDDPFRRMFRPPAARPVEPAPAPHPEEPLGADAWHGDGYDDPHRHGPDAYADHAEGYYAHGAHDGVSPDAGRHPAQDEAYEPYDDGHHPAAAYDDRYHAADMAAHRDDAGLADEYLEPDAASMAALPDAWAAGGAPEIEPGPAPAGAVGGSSARRPVLVLALVLALTGGGLAASFLAKGSSPGAAAVGSKGASNGAPTILAAAGPTKVKVEDPSATAPEDQDAALLNKGAAAPSGPVKIVSSEEQPADLGQLPKSDLAAGARPLPAPPPSPFPEPKKVKTFVVHPDGTMLSGDGTGSAAPDALPATPKTSSRGGTTPKSAPAPAPAAEAAYPTPAGATIASLSGDPALPGPATPAPTTGTPRQPAAPGAGYGLQLASSPVEADANAAFAKLKKKYPAQLGNLTASVHKAETGDRPVYRVRVGSMTQDEAKALCGQLQGAGGACFVVHN